MTLRLAIGWALALGMICASIASAQDDQKKKKGEPATRSIQGMVTDTEGKSITGAVVQLKNSRTLQVRSYNSKEEGEYHFSTLKADDDYQVKANYNGMTSGWRTVSVFDTRKIVVLNLKLDKSEKPDKEQK